jgi:hypothetical protein
MATVVATLLTYPLQVVQARARVSCYPPHLPSPGGPGQGQGELLPSSPTPSRWSRPGRVVTLLTYPLQVVSARARLSCWWQWWPPSSPIPSRWSRPGKRRVVSDSDGHPTHLPPPSDQGRARVIVANSDGHPPYLPSLGGSGEGQGELLLPACGGHPAHLSPPDDIGQGQGRFTTSDGHPPNQPPPGDLGV